MSSLVLTDAVTGQVVELSSFPKAKPKAKKQSRPVDIDAEYARLCKAIETVCSELDVEFIRGTQDLRDSSGRPEFFFKGPNGLAIAHVHPYSSWLRSDEKNDWRYDCRSDGTPYQVITWKDLGSGRVRDFIGQVL